MATQNPIEQGRHALLPEAQFDRFLQGHRRPPARGGIARSSKGNLAHGLKATAVSSGEEDREAAEVRAVPVPTHVQTEVILSSAMAIPVAEASPQRIGGRKLTAGAGIITARCEGLVLGAKVKAPLVGQHVAR